LIGVYSRRTAVDARADAGRVPASARRADNSRQLDAQFKSLLKHRWCNSKKNISATGNFASRFRLDK
jgi:hypothetical protein